MGNGQSLKIILDSDKQDGAGSAVVKAGTQMRGKVALKIDENHRGLSLSLAFRGSECTYNAASRCKKNLARQHNFFEKNLVLFDENSGEIKPGSYTFPFQIDLPDTLPTSTNSRGKWKVKYALSSRITDPDHAQLSEHECKRKIIVLAASLPDERVPRMSQPVTIKIEGRGSANKGTVSLGAKVVNSIVGRGEDLKVSVACRNHSTVDIARVKVQVVQQEVWFADQRGTAKRQENIILEHECVDLPGLLKTRQKKAMLTRDPESEDNEAVHQEIQKDLMSHRSRCNIIRSRCNIIHISIPKSTPKAYFDTYLGKLVKVSHSVKISLVARAMGGHSFVEIPIRIGISPPPSTTATLLSTVATHPAAAAPPPQLPQDEIPLVVAVRMSAERNEAQALIAAQAPAEEMAHSESLEGSDEVHDETPSLTFVPEEVRAILVM